METSRPIAIIPAAGKPTNKILTHTNLPDTMLPINGKPVIGYILDDLLARTINDAIIVLNQADTQTENYVVKKFGSKMSLQIVYNQAYERGLGYSIVSALEHIKTATNVLVYLGDTIYKGDLALDVDFLVTSPEYESSDKWCFVEQRGLAHTFINKPKDYTGDGLVLSGLYHFTDVAHFKQAATAAESRYHTIEISHILEQYTRPFQLVAANAWYDCGNIENFYRAKIDFLKTRSFNTVIYNDLYGSITKTGDKKEKLENEINWYKNIPEELKVFSPRLLDYSMTDDRVAYSLEYYGYQSLADYFIFNHFDEKVWRLLIDRLFDIIALFKKYPTRLPFAFFDEMYRHKTTERITTLRQDPYWDTLFAQPTITVNGSALLGWPHYEAGLRRLTERLYNESDMTFLHGDLCLSNILFDPNNRIFKFIDPRGSFGTTSVYGDIKYDIAKLRHSFNGRYDFIVSDLFTVEENNNGFTLTIFDETEHEHIATYFDIALEQHGYNLELVRTIEALLFLSMIPLHDDAPERQKAMFVTGLTLLNQITL